MRKGAVCLIVLFGLVLSACGTRLISSNIHAATPPPTSTSQAVDSPTATSVEPTATAAPPTTTPPTLTPTEVPGIGSTQVSDIDGSQQVYVPAGEFKLGADNTDGDAKRTIEGGRAYPEGQQQILYLDSFWIDKYEVTNKHYRQCVDAGACLRPYLDQSETRTNYHNNPEYDNFPVIYVNWFMAGEYCKWAGRRLPTEAEWEKAARGTDGRKYPWGNDPVSSDKANFCDINCITRSHRNGAFDDGWGDTAPVGSYPAGISPYGALDMSGNVWEWTSTIIKDYPYDPNDGREDQSAPGERVWRGGPWSNGIWWLRSSLRYRSIPSYWNVNLGFRCASSE
jgi:serine/threonine-protein kinase